MKTFYTSVCLALLTASLAGAAPMPVKSWEKNTDGVVLRLQPGTMKLQVCDNRIVRVLYSPSDSIPDQKSFVITKKWPHVRFSVNENSDEVTLSTTELLVSVNRRTGAVTFADKTGHILLQEAADGGKAMTPTAIEAQPTFISEQTFNSPPDEALYGLGQYQDGLWNWRGIPRQLQQINGQIGLPMIVSSKGYGLLWDNASLTDFNPVDNEVALTRENQTTTNAPQSREPVVSTWHGSFQSREAGDYVVDATTDNNRVEFSVRLDGKELTGVSNYFTPLNLSAPISLSAKKTCDFTIRTTGKEPKLFIGVRANTTTFRSHFASVIDYTFFYGPELDDVVRGYRTATGEAPLWPEWAYGFWQCRERYHDQKELLNAAAEFRRRNIPLDLIIQDWQYWPPHAWGNYDWDTNRYPNPAGMISQLHAENVKFMISVWCNPNGSTREELATNNLVVNGHVDVYSPRARQIRWNHLDDAFFKIGTDAWWGDSTEPGDDGRVLRGQRTSLGLGDAVQNAFPLFASEGLYEGQRAATSDKRVCILTRSAFPGNQRYAAASWSGDISGNWITFKRQIPAGLNFCITGIPYWTTDCAGFWRSGDQQYTSPDYNELLARWFEWSTFCPIQRIHGGNTATEMWNFLPATQKILVAYDELRHRMLPYNYSVAWRVTSDGYTIMRPLAMDFRADEKALGISDEYLFGPAMLVAPVTEAQATSKSVYLPSGASWVNFWTGEKFAGGNTVNVSAPPEQIPLFVRAGSIVPLGPVVQFAGEKPADPLELRVYRGADGAFTLYEDEGDSYRYERGVHATIPISWNEEKQTLTIGKRTGKFPGMLEKRSVHVVFVSRNHGAGAAAEEKADAEIQYAGKSVTVRPK